MREGKIGLTSSAMGLLQAGELACIGYRKRKGRQRGLGLPTRPPLGIHAQT